MFVKCYKCHTRMIKDEYSRTATCPCCGRTVKYRTKAEKKAANNTDTDSAGCLGITATIMLIPIGIAFLLVLLLAAIFGDGVWSFVGGLIAFFGKLLWGLVCLIFDLLGAILGGLFDLIFG